MYAAAIKPPHFTCGICSCRTSRFTCVCSKMFKIRSRLLNKRKYSLHLSLDWPGCFTQSACSCRDPSFLFYYIFFWSHLCVQSFLQCFVFSPFLTSSGSRLQSASITYSQKVIRVRAPRKEIKEPFCLRGDAAHGVEQAHGGGTRTPILIFEFGFESNSQTTASTLHFRKLPLRQRTFCTSEALTRGESC